MSLFTEQKINIADSNLVTAGNIKCSGPGGIGYAIGAGSTVTQATSRTTGVTINALCGAITLLSAAGPNGTAFSFTVTNNAVAASDVVIVSQKSGTDVYTVQAVTNVVAGSFKLTLNAAGNTVEQPVFNFAVIKAVTA